MAVNPTHVVSTQDGLLLGSRSAVRSFQPGYFFGLTWHSDAIYAFHAGSRPYLGGANGAIVVFQRLETGLSRPKVLFEGLDNGCHQIDFIDGRLHAVDTYRQKLLVFDERFRGVESFDILPMSGGRDWARGYVHANSLLGNAEGYLLLFHNGARHTGRPSMLASFDARMNLRGRRLLPGHGCHDLALLEDGELLSCGSDAGALINDQRQIASIAPGMMTRGLSVGADEIVVAASPFAARENRWRSRGRLFFLSRDYDCLAEHDIPSPPRDICRLDGEDLSLSARVAECLTPWLGAA